MAARAENSLDAALSPLSSLSLGSSLLPRWGVASARAEALVPEAVVAVFVIKLLLLLLLLGLLASLRLLASHPGSAPVQRRYTVVLRCHALR